MVFSKHFEQRWLTQLSLSSENERFHDFKQKSNTSSYMDPVQYSNEFHRNLTKIYELWKIHRGVAGNSVGFRASAFTLPKYIVIGC